MVVKKSLVNNLLKFDEQGTTLVEAIVSVLIFSVGIIPSLTIILLANSFSSSIKNNLIASSLAQEGIEVVRAIRDNNWFNNRSFDSGLASGTYRIDWNSTSLLAEDVNPPLKLSSAGLYNYTSGADTGFQRRIIITKDPTVACNCELKIITEITWAERGKTQTITVESHLFNWR